jgi:CBS domain-containing protein
VSRDKIGIEVKDLMSSPVITITKKDTVEQAAKIMSRKNFGSIVVTDTKKKLIGIITERDIVKRIVAMNRLPSEVRVEEIMSHPVLTFAPDGDIKEAANLMKQHGIRRLVIVDKGKMVGIVTSRDLLDEIVMGER